MHASYIQLTESPSHNDFAVSQFMHWYLNPSLSQRRLLLYAVNTFETELIHELVVPKGPKGETPWLMQNFGIRNAQKDCAGCLYRVVVDRRRVLDGGDLAPTHWCDGAMTATEVVTPQHKSATIRWQHIRHNSQRWSIEELNEDDSVICASRVVLVSASLVWVLRWCRSLRDPYCRQVVLCQSFVQLRDESQTGELWQGRRE